MNCTYCKTPKIFLFKTEKEIKICGDCTKILAKNYGLAVNALVWCANKGDEHAQKALSELNPFEKQ